MTLYRCKQSVLAQTFLRHEVALLYPMIYTQSCVHIQPVTCIYIYMCIYIIYIYKYMHVLYVVCCNSYIWKIYFMFYIYVTNSTGYVYIYIFMYIHIGINTLYFMIYTQSCMIYTQFTHNRVPIQPVTYIYIYVYVYTYMYVLYVVCCYSYIWQIYFMYL